VDAVSDERGWGEPLTDGETAEFVARLRATRTVPDASDEAVLELARASRRVRVPRGTVLFEAGTPPDRGYLVASGTIDQVVRSEGGTEHCVLRATTGYGIGEVPTLSGGLHLTTARAASDDVVIDCFPLPIYQDFLGRHPGSLAKILLVTRRRNFRALVGRALARALHGGAPYELAPLLDAFEPLTLERGQALFRLGDRADGWYVVVTGRLRVTIIDEEGREKIIAELGAGQALGELALLTHMPREATAIASRDTTVARVPGPIFLEWIEQFPALLRACFTTLVQRAAAVARGSQDARRRGARVFALVEASRSAPVREIGASLTAGFAHIGTVLHVSPRVLEERNIVANVRDVPPDHPCWMRVAAWIEESVATHAFVVLETDRDAPAWEQLAIRLSDCVVAIGRAGEHVRPALPLGDEGLDPTLAPARYLVLVQDDDAVAPRGAERWLAELPEFRPLHMRLGSTADGRRAARTLAQRAVALALGGGGARGLAHIGVLQAFDELGIPVDVIGGTSMGSIIAAQYAMGLTPREMIRVNRDLANLRPFSDYTVPMFALLRTRRITSVAREAFGDRTIESLWLPYVAVSANLASAELVIHERGPVWRATRASGALPGIAEPAIEGNEALIDGGVLNNLPGDVLRERFGGTLVAVSVSPKEERRFAVTGFPSPWSAALRWLGSSAMNAPTIVDIMTRAVTLTSARRARFVEREADVFVAPPIDAFGLLDFHRIDAIVEAGYRHTLAQLTQSRGALP
jgi:predicted acylesterase/phospholipase RssA/CRP-like cAMP-binding protein